MSRKPKYFFQCLKCKETLKDVNETNSFCPKCSGPLSVQMNIAQLKEIISKNNFYKQKITSMWSFFEFLPLLDKKKIISLMEGNTPTIKSNRLAEDFSLKNLFLKLDFLNPTGSFKDRQISMGVSKAIELNKTSVITVSSGNVGASVAAYSARAGLKNIILIPSIAPESKIIQIKQYGGNVVRIESDSTKFISQIVQNASKKFEMSNLITAGIYNPFIIKGAKTISYEIAIQSRTSKQGFPDVIIVPVGGSGLLSGIYEGFEELYELDFIESIPKLFGVQPEGCAPFVNAIENDLTPEYLFQNPWKNIKTISTALADDIPLDCYTGIPALKNSGGNALAVSDDETLAAGKQLSNLEGIFAEPSSCTTVAVIPKLLEKGFIQPDEIIYCLITGSGFKDIKSIEPMLSDSINVKKDFDWKNLFEKILKS
ncbi:MAG: threonine synthase [Promethearchaeota archaeon]